MSNANPIAAIAHTSQPVNDSRPSAATPPPCLPCMNTSTCKNDTADRRQAYRRRGEQRR